jgi:hypothetical protein
MAYPALFVNGRGVDYPRIAVNNPFSSESIL